MLQLPNLIKISLRIGELSVLILLGYPNDQKGYKLYNLESHQVILNRDVVFEEDKFPFKQPQPAVGPHMVSEFPSFGDLVPDTSPMETPHSTNNFGPETVDSHTPLQDNNSASETPYPNTPLHENSSQSSPETTTNDAAAQPQQPQNLRKSTKRPSKSAWLKDFITTKRFHKQFSA